MITDGQALGGTRPLPFSQLLTHLVNDHDGERMTLIELSGGLRDRAWGGLLFIFALLNFLPLPPGVTTITAIPLVVLTAQLAAGRKRPWFPRRLDERGISKDHLARIAAKIGPWEDRVERFLKPRLFGLTDHRSARAIGVVCLVLSAIIWLPIPLGNHAPAFSIALFALALVYRDGVVAILAALATVVSLVLASLTVGAAWWAVVALSRHLLPS